MQLNPPDIQSVSFPYLAPVDRWHNLFFFFSPKESVYREGRERERESTEAAFRTIWTLGWLTG